MVIKNLVRGLEHVLFFHILGIIIPIDFHIFHKGWYTINQLQCGAPVRYLSWGSHDSNVTMVYDTYNELVFMG